MLRRFLRFVHPGLWGLIFTVGCATRTSPPAGQGAATMPENAKRVTIHVPGMIESQGIT